MIKERGCAMRVKIVGIFLLSVFVFGVIGLRAQDVPAQEEWNPVTAGPITAWIAPLCGKSKLVVQPFFFYTHTRGAFDSEGDYHALDKGDKKSQYQQMLFAQYGITDKLEIDAQTSYLENHVKKDAERAHSEGFGDSWLFGRYCLVEEKDWMPHIAVLFQLKIPTGKYQHSEEARLDTDLMGNGSWDEGLGVILTKKLKPFILHADCIYTIPQRVKVDDTTTTYAPYLNYDFAVEYVLLKGFNLMVEINGVCQGDKREFGKTVPASDSNSLVFAPGIGWSNDKIQTLLAYQRTVCGANADANDSVVLTCVFTF